MSLFSSTKRTYLGPASHRESTYTYLERSARPEFEKVREELESWWVHYPEEEKAELKRRLITEFRAAFYELFLHELCRRAGFELKLHPAVPDTTRRPDFLVKGRGAEFYLEAASSSDSSQSEEREEAVLQTFYEEINKVDSPNFFLRLVHVEIPATGQPSGRRIRVFLEREFRELDPDEIAASMERDGLDGAPVLRYRDGELTVEVQPIPKSPKLRGAPDVRPIGIYPMESRVGGSASSLRRVLFSKAGRYGKPDLPFVIAVNCLGLWGGDQIDIMEALFGTEQIVFIRGTEEPEMRRAPDGLFHGPTGPQYTRVSAVLITTVWPWSLGKAPLQLIHNPWAETPIEATVFPFFQRVPTGQQMAVVPGAGIKDYFRFAEDWPQDESGSEA